MAREKSAPSLFITAALHVVGMLIVGWTVTSGPTNVLVFATVTDEVVDGEISVCLRSRWFTMLSCISKSVFEFWGWIRGSSRQGNLKLGPT